MAEEDVGASQEPDIRICFPKGLLSTAMGNIHFKGGGNLSCRKENPELIGPTGKLPNWKNTSPFSGSVSCWLHD